MFSTEHLNMVFSAEGKAEGFKKLTRDLITGTKTFNYDENGNRYEISKRDANEAVRKTLLEIYGLDETTVKNDKTRKRARKLHDDECFEMIESDIDFIVNEGFQNDEWFDRFVEDHNLKLGDDEEFWTKKDIMLIVAEISGDHHDLTMQYLNEPTKTPIHMKKHGVRIGRDIDLILLGRIDYTELIDKISEAFIYDIKTMVYTAVYGAAANLNPNAQFNKNGNLVKATLDDLIADVSIANNAEAVIMGTRNALKKLTTLAQVNWIADSQKESVANTGRLGSYEGTELIEIPQRFKKGTTSEKLFDDNMLLVFAGGDDKFVKLLRRGEVEILEKGDNKGDLADDYRSYEVQEEYGTAVIISKYFGRYIIED